MRTPRRKPADREPASAQATITSAQKPAVARIVTAALARRANAATAGSMATHMADGDRRPDKDEGAAHRRCRRVERGKDGKRKDQEGED